MSAETMSFSPVSLHVQPHASSHETINKNDTSTRTLTHRPQPKHALRALTHIHSHTHRTTTRSRCLKTCAAVRCPGSRTRHNPSATTASTSAANSPERDSAAPCASRHRSACRCHYRAAGLPRLCDCRVRAGPTKLVLFKIRLNLVLEFFFRNLPLRFCCAVHLVWVLLLADSESLFRF